ncbi:MULTISPECIES: hypothetical protein [Bacillus cereus group]|uniref:Uncharacterized protein n=1 Tax=Bacillus cereus (strain ZK / E33L) TaxID=288681 RepID=Q4V264_BACCZ|nr:MULTISPECIES: hypothetical protein [Bacillus cereus group]AAY60193.1 hypothetical protein pE33L466_0022 [Bacillus cereus E33L]AJI26170.1 hypothetical protein BF28_5773 [Bacillus cereus E33L]MCG3425921.1 hypothetical protein [Bacillus thuringiensis]MED0951787.1 hypothetical protein [Bacillus mobilis]MED0997558.1 hypothetical protein [Bacillus mobilis]
MNKFIRELKAEELTKHVGGVDSKNETVIHDGGGAGPNCKSLLNQCILKNFKACGLFDQYCYREWL